MISKDAYMRILVNSMHHESVIMGLFKAHRWAQLESWTPTGLTRGLGNKIALVYRLMLNLFLEATCRTSISSISCEDIHKPITFLASANSFSRSIMFFLDTITEGIVDGGERCVDATSHIIRSRDVKLQHLVKSIDPQYWLGNIGKWEPMIENLWRVDQVREIQEQANFHNYMEPSSSESLVFLSIGSLLLSGALKWNA